LYLDGAEYEMLNDSGSGIGWFSFNLPVLEPSQKEELHGFLKRLMFPSSES